MPEWFMKELKEYHHESKLARFKIGDAWQGEERQFVFHSGFGKPFYHSTPTATWSKFIARHGLKKIRLHDLRHSAATLLIEAGASLKAVQERLGHSKYEVTANLYAHVTKKTSRETADRLDKFDPEKRHQSVIKALK